MVNTARTSGSDTAVAVWVTATVEPSFKLGADGVPG